MGAASAQMGLSKLPRLQNLG